MSDPEVSIVVPTFNEAESVGPLIAEIHKALGAIDEQYEVLFVDDGSTDQSALMLQDLARTDSSVRVLQLTHHCGKSAALDAGFRRVNGSLVVMLDADLQNDPADIPMLLHELRDREAVVGVWIRRRDNQLRRASSWIANTIRRGLTGDSTRDSGCGIQAFLREVLVEIPMFEGLHRFLPTLARLAGGRVKEVPVNHRARRFGRAKSGVWNRAVPAFLDLLAVRWMQKRRIDRSLAKEVTPDRPDSTTVRKLGG
jgi:glycosyltransferase involved in cell wall biosynthesis